MDYKYEFKRYYEMVEQFMQSPKSKAAFTALKNAHEYYKHLIERSDNSDYVKCEYCGNKTRVIGYCVSKGCSMNDGKHFAKSQEEVK